MIKNLTKVVTLVIGMIGLSMSSNAQTTATATGSASATILTPISIEAVNPLNFGDVVANSTNTGTIVMETSGDRTASNAATASIGASSAATFDVDGEANYTFSITLPATATLLHTNSTDQMIVDTFKTNLAENTGTLSALGAASFTVGATLNVGVSQLEGAYTGSYDVTVAYN